MDEMTLKDITFAGGILRTPEDWIWVNTEYAFDCKYAYTIHSMNSNKFDFPTFVYLSNERGTISDEEMNEIKLRCDLICDGFYDNCGEIMQYPIPTEAEAKENPSLSFFGEMILN